MLDAYGDQLAADLNELSAMITTEDLLAWNVQTDLESVSPTTSRPSGSGPTS